MSIHESELTSLDAMREKTHFLIFMQRITVGSGGEKGGIGILNLTWFSVEETVQTVQIVSEVRD